MERFLSNLRVSIKRLETECGAVDSLMVSSLYSISAFILNSYFCAQTNMKYQYISSCYKQRTVNCLQLYDFFHKRVFKKIEIGYYLQSSQNTISNQIYSMKNPRRVMIYLNIVLQPLRTIITFVIFSFCISIQHLFFDQLQILQIYLEIAHSDSQKQIMTRIPLKQTIFEKQEINANGCCINHLINKRNDPYLVNPSRIRVYSQPKESKTKKIEVVTARKGYSQGKDTNHTNGSLSHEKLTTGSRNEKMSPMNSRVTFNYNSKYQVEPSKNFKALPNSNFKLNRASQVQYQNQTQIPHKLQPYTPKKATEPTSSNFQSIQYISQISLVSEEFISQGSAINIANLIKNHQPPSYHTNHLQVPNKIIFRAQQASQLDRKNPVQRLMDRKRYQLKAQNRKKKIVI